MGLQTSGPAQISVPSFGFTYTTKTQSYIYISLLFKRSHVAQVGGDILSDRDVETSRGHLVPQEVLRPPELTLMKDLQISIHGIVQCCPFDRTVGESIGQHVTSVLPHKCKQNTVV